MQNKKQTSQNKFLMKIRQSLFDPIYWILNLFSIIRYTDRIQKIFHSIYKLSLQGHQNRLLESE